MGISIQTWAASILPKIREVDAHITPADQSRIREGHPEVSFALMNGGHAVTEPKSTSAGRDARLRLLEQHLPGVREQVEKQRVFRADVIDAFAMLWMASTPTGENRQLGAPAPAVSATASPVPCPSRPSATPAGLPCKSGLDMSLRLSLRPACGSKEIVFSCSTRRERSK